MYYKTFLIFLLIGIFSCGDISSKRIVNNTKIPYRTTDPSKLYFKNIKSIAYYVQTVEPNRMEKYTFRKFDKSNEQPNLYPLIINNWMEDEAYIFLEKNDFPNWADPMTIQVKADTATYDIQMLRAGKEHQYDFAEKLFQNIQAKNDLSVKVSDSTYLPFLQNYRDRIYFMTVMKDYYRLIEKD